VRAEPTGFGDHRGRGVGQRVPAHLGQRRGLPLGRPRRSTAWPGCR
jgi:hypothetical protein